MSTSGQKIPGQKQCAALGLIIMKTATEKLMPRITINGVSMKGGALKVVDPHIDKDFQTRTPDLCKRPHGS